MAAAMSREVVGEEVVVDETEFFISAIYIGGALVPVGATNRY